MWLSTVSLYPLLRKILQPPFQSAQCASSYSVLRAIKHIATGVPSPPESFTRGALICLPYSLR